MIGVEVPCGEDRPLQGDWRSPAMYLAGPMSGRPAYNVEVFAEGVRRMGEEGWHCCTPFDSNSAVWRRYHGRDFDPYHDTCDYGDPILSEMIAENMLLLSRCTAIGLLPGWRESKGALLEVLTARLMGKTVVDTVTYATLFRDQSNAPIPLTANDFAASVRITSTPSEEPIEVEARRLVSGDRQKAYGHPGVDYTRTGRMWGAMLGIPDINPATACLMMCAVKMSREVNGHKRDNLVDLIGYTLCVDRIQTEPLPLEAER